jgi:anti-sigma B factor antagonist
MQNRGSPVHRLVVDVEKAVDQATATVRLRGDVDLATAPALQHRLEALLGDGVRTLVVDMGGVPFCDMPGLNALLSVQARLAGNGGHLVLLAACRPLRIMVDALGLGARLCLMPSPDVVRDGDDVTASPQANGATRPRDC